MSSTTESHRTEQHRSEEESSTVFDAPPRRRARAFIVVGLVIVMAAVAVLVATKPFSRTSGPVGGVADNADPTSTTTVSLEDISSQTEVSATLGYAGTYTVINQAQGTVTDFRASER